MTAHPDDHSGGELIPGTEILLQTSEGLRSASELILIPEPSNEPDDPLVRSLLSATSLLDANTKWKELEPCMEGDCAHQPSNLRLHLYSHPLGYRAFNTNLHPRVSYYAAESQHAGGLPSSFLFTLLLTKASSERQRWP